MTINDLANALMITRQSIRLKLKQGLINKLCVMSSLGDGKHIYRFDPIKLKLCHPKLKPIIEHYLLRDETQRFYTISDFAKKAKISRTTVRRRIDDKKIPAIEIPSVGKKKLFRIDSTIFVEQHPEYKCVF